MTFNDRYNKQHDNSKRDKDNHIYYSSSKSCPRVITNSTDNRGYTTYYQEIELYRRLYPIKKLDNVVKADLVRGSKSNGITLELNERTNPAPIEAEASDNFCFLESINSIYYILISI